MPERILRPEILTSERINQLDWEQEVFYRRLMSVVDDYGRFDARPSILRAALYPLAIERVREANVQRSLRGCVAAGLVRLYSSSGKAFLEVADFRQRMRAASSKYPPPPENDTPPHADAGGCMRMPADARGRVTMPSEAEAETETETETETMLVESVASPPGEARAAVAAPTSMSDEDWLRSLSENPAYAGLDVPREHAKMVAWCGVNRKQPTRKRFVNWINRADKPLQSIPRTAEPSARQEVIKIKQL